jgi:hypothetical protein
LQIIKARSQSLEGKSMLVDMASAEFIFQTLGKMSAYVSIDVNLSGKRKCQVVDFNICRKSTFVVRHNKLLQVSLESAPGQPSFWRQ